MLPGFVEAEGERDHEEGEASEWRVKKRTKRMRAEVTSRKGEDLKDIVAAARRRGKRSRSSSSSAPRGGRGGGGGGGRG